MRGKAETNTYNSICMKINLSSCSSFHGICFPCSCLTICKYSTVIALKYFIHNRRHSLLIQFLLQGVRTKDLNRIIQHYNHFHRVIRSQQITQNHSINFNSISLENKTGNRTQKIIFQLSNLHNLRPQKQTKPTKPQV